MPPEDADAFPTDARAPEARRLDPPSLDSYDAEHAGEPGRVTVRRLTSAEYAYAVRDLTGIDITSASMRRAIRSAARASPTSATCSSCRTTSVERYLEAAKQVADHAVIGAGPLEFYADPGKTGLELSALNRIDQLYATQGLPRRVGGRRPAVRPRSLRQGVLRRLVLQASRGARRTDRDHSRLAAKEGITGRFAEHIWDGGQQAEHRVSDARDVDGWQELPAPGADVQASVAKARAGCDAISTRRSPPGPAGFSRAAISRPAAPATRVPSCSTTPR